MGKNFLQEVFPHALFTFLYVEPEQNDVAVLHDVLLALGADETCLLGGVHGAETHEIVVGDDLGADEAALKVGVNLTGGLRSLGALHDGPGAYLLGACGQVADETQQGVAGTNETVTQSLPASESFPMSQLFA